MLPSTRRRFEVVEKLARDVYDGVRDDRIEVKKAVEALTKRIDGIAREIEPDQSQAPAQVGIFGLWSASRFMQDTLAARVKRLETNVGLLLKHLGLERCDKPATKTLCKKKGK